MIRYVLAAVGLKLLSATPQMRRFYRSIGNVFGAKLRIRGGLPKSYVDRAHLFLRLCEKYDAIQKGNKLLEVGTGWLHWDSIFIRLFHDVEITLFDVWDNRQLEPLREYFRELDKLIDKEIDIAPEQHKHVHSLLQAISKVNTFDDLYHLLDFRYVIEPSGSLRRFQDESFDAIFGFNVLEHCKKDTLHEFIHDFYRLLKPGGYSIHKIDIGDHLAYYDRSVSVKHYLRYSDRVWKRWFENELQYINRVQRSEWLSIFHSAGFELVEEESLLCNIDTIAVDKKYEDLDRQDLECYDLWVVHRKPPNGKNI